jgi:hypothetical protein
MTTSGAKIAARAGHVGDRLQALLDQVAEDHAAIEPERVAADRITPVAPRTPTQVLTWKTPISVRNSPTKPEVPGRPTLAMVNSMKIERVGRHPVHEAAIGVDLARVHPVVDHADAEEERAGDEAVADHLEDRAVDALLVGPRRCPWSRSPYARPRIGDQLLHVLLHHRHQRGVDDGDHRQPQDEVGQTSEPPGTSAAESAGSRSRPSSAGSPPARPSPRSAPARARPAARCAPATSASSPRRRRRRPATAASGSPPTICQAQDVDRLGREDVR